MKITEIVWEDGRQYEDNFGNTWIVDGKDLFTEDSECISDCYNLKTVLEMYFEEVIDWSKVEVDTPIWVKWSDGTYRPRHFAKYENGQVYYWTHGKTKHTTSCCVYVYGYDKDVLLTKPKEVQ